MCATPAQACLPLELRAEIDREARCTSGISATDLRRFEAGFRCRRADELDAFVPCDSICFTGIGWWLTRDGVVVRALVLGGAGLRANVGLADRGVGSVLQA